MTKILHVISQRPGWTGSGVALDALTRAASKKGWDQCAVLGTPHDDPHPSFGGLDSANIFPLQFGEGVLDFKIPGMSDVMPYPSSRFSQLTPVQLDAYRSQWSQHLRSVIAETKPDLIHSHHIWLLSSLIRDVAPDLPVVTHSHGTGLRQLELCPHLAEEVTRGCRRNDHFFVLHRANRETLKARLQVEDERITTLGNGYREDVFHSLGRNPSRAPILAYAGKLSHAKGVPWLLDACDRVHAALPNLQLHVAGSGAGQEADSIVDRMARTPYVTFHGQVDQTGLADILRDASVFTLPSFYEGLPLVLVEAAACGCSLVATELPGVLDPLAPILGESLRTVPMPDMVSIDEPNPNALPRFVEDLTEALTDMLSRPESPELNPRLARMTWTGIFENIEKQWQARLAS